MGMDWADVKEDGSDHYKTGGGAEPIDLYKSGGMLHDYCITGIIKYAFRNRSQVRDVGCISEKDLDKIIHCAQLLKAARREALSVEHP